jgi:phosphoribosyl-AMP cyclohydrolase
MIKKTKKIIKKTQFHVLAIIATQVENRRVFVQVFHRTEAVERSVVKKGAASFF